MKYMDKSIEELHELLVKGEVTSDELVKLGCSMEEYICPYESFITSTSYFSSNNFWSKVKAEFQVVGFSEPSYPKRSNACVKLNICSLFFPSIVPETSKANSFLNISLIRNVFPTRRLP